MSQVRSWIKEMTLEEKVRLLSGADFWSTVSVERLGIPSIVVGDGPHGVRKPTGETDAIGLSDSVPATCFPTGSALAATWNPQLIEGVGQALGKEARFHNIDLLLGPAINIKRSPLCGRNFEYYSEDPYLTKKLASSYIEGVQSQGVGTSIKHYVANNQEHRRMSINAEVELRPLNEIYLEAFKEPIQLARPWSVMCGYNMVNGDLLSENKVLLKDVLREQWGFDGFVVSDWGAVNDRVKGIQSGMDLEMPGCGGLNDTAIYQAIKSGELDEASIDASVASILSGIVRAIEGRKHSNFVDTEGHHTLARQVAEEGIVLLKNENGLLPLAKTAKIAIIGQMAKAPRYQGGGSSRVHPTQVDTVYDSLCNKLGQSNISYASGYNLKSDHLAPDDLDTALRTAKQAEYAILFVGLPDHYESEGFDRLHMKLPPSHNQLVKEISKLQPNTIVVLNNGSPVEMPWVQDVGAILEGYLTGQASGSAMANILVGDVSPSGKLAETFPIRLEHNPSHLFFPGVKDYLKYGEGIYVGYRYYDTKFLEVLFPFGHGLSYSAFEYEGLRVINNKEEETLKVSFSIKNIGKRLASEVAQLYIQPIDTLIDQPYQMLKGFKKISIKPGEAVSLQIDLTYKDFAYFDSTRENWHVETATYGIAIGSSSRDMRLQTQIELTGDRVDRPLFHENSLVGDILECPDVKGVLLDFLAGVMKAEDKGQDVNPEMAAAMMKYMPLRALKYFSESPVTQNRLKSLLKALNKSL